MVLHGTTVDMTIYGFISYNGYTGYYERPVYQHYGTTGVDRYSAGISNAGRLARGVVLYPTTVLHGDTLAGGEYTTVPFAYNSGYFKLFAQTTVSGVTGTILDVEGYLCFANRFVFTNTSGVSVVVKTYIPDDRVGKVMFWTPVVAIETTVASGDSITVTVFEGCMVSVRVADDVPADYFLNLTPKDSGGSPVGNSYSGMGEIVIDTANDASFVAYGTAKAAAGAGDHAASPLQDVATLACDDAEYGGKSLLHGSDGYPLYNSTRTALLYKDPMPTPDPPSPIADFAIITISWTGTTDLDICAYWTDVPATTVGWNNNAAGASPAIQWQGDNVGLGPEYINLGVTAATRLAGVTTYTFRIHGNFYSGGTGTANVEVTFGATTLNKDFTPSSHTAQKATTSDPYVTITFAADGTPTAIN